MGGSSSSSKFREARILLLGVEAVGKTGLLYKLKNNDSRLNEIPTAGFNVDEIKYKNFRLTMWDLAGNVKSRPLWDHYYKNVHGVIYIVDSADICRLDMVKNNLLETIQNERLRDSIFLIYANKQDLAYALKPQEIIDRFKLNEISDRILHVQGSSFLTGEGIYEGLDWLVDQIGHKFF